MNNKKLFILGAGASRELKFNINTVSNIGVKVSPYSELGPLSNGYFYYVNKFIEKFKAVYGLIRDIEIYDSLADFIMDYYLGKNKDRIDIEQIKENEKISKKLNIEGLYVALEDKIEELESYKTTSNNNFDGELFGLSTARIQLIDYIHKSWAMICYYCYSQYHKILANYIVRTGSDVISFNWDILLDEAMYETGNWDYRDGYGFVPKDIIDKNEIKRVPNYRDEKHIGGFNNIILKLHGSINWYKEVDQEDDGICVAVQLRRDERSGIYAELGTCEFMHGRKRQFHRFIIPPGRKRNQNDFIWEKIEGFLKKAEEIIAIGFSFNDFDIHVIKEFKKINFKDSVKIKIINPGQEELIDKYKEVFKINNVDKIHDKFSNYCRWIVQQKGMEDLFHLLA